MLDRRSAAGSCALELCGKEDWGKGETASRITVRVKLSRLLKYLEEERCPPRNSFAPPCSPPAVASPTRFLALRTYLPRFLASPAVVSLSEDRRLRGSNGDAGALSEVRFILRGCAV